MIVSQQPRSRTQPQPRLRTADVPAAMTRIGPVRRSTRGAKLGYDDDGHGGKYLA
jgi:hypothetical protein